VQHIRVLALLGLIAGVIAQPRAAETQPAGAVGSTVRSFSVRQPDGGTVTLPEHVKDTKAVVVVFLAFDCPVAKSYITPLNDLAKTYAAKGVSVVAICPNEGAAEVKKQAAEFKVSFPIFADPEEKAVRELGAKRVPEAFVLDAKGVIRYRGRVDDRWISPGKSNPRPPVPNLANALDEVLAGKAVALAETPAVGCPVGSSEKTKPVQPTDTKVTFYKDVLPVLQNRCQECHRPGEVGPFSLLTYKQAVQWSDLIKEYTASRAMPPWRPAGGPAYLRDRTMPKAEIDLIAKWVDTGCPEGDPKQAPPEKTFASATEWQFGKPDLVVEMPGDFEIGPTGPDHFRAVVMPTGLTEDKVIVAYEVKPGNPRIVHHTINYFDTTGKARELEKAEQNRKKQPNEPDRGPGYTSAMGIGFTSLKSNGIGGIGGWTPGLRGFRLPEGTGYFLPKGSDVVVQMHYHRNGKQENDRTKIGFYFAKDTNSLKQLQMLVVPGSVSPTDDYKPFSTIPAGKSEFVVRGRVITQQDCTIYSVLPHMHMLGKNIKVTMTPPGGKELLLVHIPEWDYNWQESYFFKDPIAVKTGTMFEVTATFDNSTSNPNNPFSPPRNVKRGDQTTDEMLFGFLRATSNTPGAMIPVKFLTEKSDYEAAPKP
jgi:peroxiredoxin